MQHKEIIRKFPLWFFTLFQICGEFGEFALNSEYMDGQICLCLGLIFMCVSVLRFCRFVYLIFKAFRLFFMRLFAGIYSLPQREAKVPNTICICVCLCVYVCDLSRQLIVYVSLEIEMGMGTRTLQGLVDHDSRLQIFIGAFVCLIDLFKYLCSSIVKSNLMEILFMLSSPL